MIYYTSKLFFMFYFAKLTESNTSSAIKMRCAVARAEPESVKCTRIRMIQTGHDDVLRTRMATIPFILSYFPLMVSDVYSCAHIEYRPGICTIYQLSVV